MQKSVLKSLSNFDSTSTAKSDKKSFITKFKHFQKIKMTGQCHWSMPLMV